MKSKKSHISEENFSRYLNDQMTDLERNAFERELQKHPFEAEALEGFQQISPADLDTDLQELKTKIIPYKKHSKFRFWAAAATFLLLVSAGLIWFQVKDKSPVPEMAESKIIQKEETKPEPDFQKEIESKTEQITEKPAVEKKALNQKNISTEKTENKPDDIEIIESVSEQEITAADSEIPVNEPEINTLNNSEKENNANEKIAFALHAESDNGITQNVRIKYPDSLKEVQIKKSISRAASPQISMKKRTEISADKKAEPEIGFEEYIKYLEKEAHFPTNYKSQNDTVKVVLKIDNEGKITAILNASPADSILFERSKEIIRNGPEWNPEFKNGKPVESETELNIIFKKTEK